MVWYWLANFSCWQKPDSRFAMQDHEPSWHQSAHPVHRVLPPTEKATIGDLANAGVAPKDIKTHLRQHFDTVVTQQDIYNRIQRASGSSVRGKAPCKPLLIN